MKRLILSLGLVWALIYMANHTLFLRASSNPASNVATSYKQASTDQRINSWGPYLPHARPPLPTDTVSPTEPRQPREVATRETEAAPPSPASTPPLALKIRKSEIGATTSSEPRKEASLERLERPGLKTPAPVPRKTKKSRSSATVKPPLAQTSAHQHSRWDAGSPRQRRGVGLFMFAPPGF
jgi:hypothetical protein